MGHITNTFIKSSTLKYYWTNKFKPKLSGPEAQKFMLKNYNL